MVPAHPSAPAAQPAPWQPAGSFPPPAATAQPAPWQHQVSPGAQSYDSAGPRDFRHLKDAGNGRFSLRKASPLRNVITFVLSTGVVVACSVVVWQAYEGDPTYNIQQRIARYFEALFSALLSFVDLKHPANADWQWIPLVGCAVTILVTLPTVVFSIQRLLSSLSRTVFDPQARTVTTGRRTYDFDAFTGFASNRLWVGVKINGIPLRVPAGTKLCMNMSNETAWDHPATVRHYGPFTRAKASQDLRDEIVSLLYPAGLEPRQRSQFA